LAEKFQSAGHVIGRAGAFQLGEEPEPLLREGERQNAVAVDRQDGRKLIVSGLPQHTRQGCHRRMSKQIRKFQFQLKRLPDPAHHLDGEQRVATEFEEVVVSSDALDAEHGAPDLSEESFCFSLRLFIDVCE
jgi:hypothetical protein